MLKFCELINHNILPSIIFLPIYHDCLPPFPMLKFALKRLDIFLSEIEKNIDKINMVTSYEEIIRNHKEKKISARRSSWYAGRCRKVSRLLKRLFTGFIFFASSTHQTKSIKPQSFLIYIMSILTGKHLIVCQKAIFRGEIGLLRLLQTGFLKLYR